MKRTLDFLSELTLAGHETTGRLLCSTSDASISKAGGYHSYLCKVLIEDRRNRALENRAQMC